MFPISFKIIDQYQQKYPSPTEKLYAQKYQTGYFCVGTNTIKLITNKRLSTLTLAPPEPTLRVYAKVLDAQFHWMNLPN